MIIKWTEGTEDLHEVVPVIWLTDDGFGCWYPSTGDVQSIAISYRNVKVDWTKVDVQKKSEEFSSYEEAVIT